MVTAPVSAFATACGCVLARARLWLD